MKVSIIGPGGIGGVVATLAARRGHEVILTDSRGTATLADQVRTLGPNATAASLTEAVQAADIVVLAMPLTALSRLPAKDFDGRIIIDMMNYYPMRESQIAVLDDGEMTSAEMVQRELPGARVIKALNNQDAPHLLLNAGTGSALPVAGDDAEAKESVAAFLRDLGYETIDAGMLSDSWRMEPGAPIYVWPYAPALPDGMDPLSDDAKVFYVTTAGTPVTRQAARELLAQAKRPARIGGFPEDLPPTWVAVVANWQEVERLSREMEARP